MNIWNTLLSYVIILVSFLAIDLTWIGVIAKKMYGNYLKDFLAPTVNWAPGLILYALLVVGMMIFVIYPAVAKNSRTSAVIMGALFGFFTYATYDLTNLATLKSRPLSFVFIDILWGMVVSAAVALIGFYVVRYLG